MGYRSAAALTVICLSIATTPAEAQRQRFKIGGGAGLASLKNTGVDLGWGVIVGGGLGFRFSDNLSIETGANFARSNRDFDILGLPVEDNQGVPAYRDEANRYHLDGTFYYHIGRRVPFHPFVFAGGGVERREEKRTNFHYTYDENNLVTDVTEEVVFDTTEYEPAAHFGAGFDLYVLYNVAARVEVRLWLPQTIDKRTQAFFFTASYYW
jgi:hypothetical protein